MTNRMCSLCGESYTDESGHDYDKCVKECRANIQQLERQQDNIYNALNDAHKHLEEALRIQRQDWWRKRREVKYDG